VTGKSERIIPVNEWIARVKTQKWVKNVQLDSYTFSNELNTGQFTVLLIIDMLDKLSIKKEYILIAGTVFIFCYAIN
jgi:hypothetical protein